MANQENNLSEYKDLKDSYNELKTQMNQIATFLQNQFGESFQNKIELRMNELSNQIKFLQTHLFPDLKDDQNESVNYKKLCDFVQKCQRSHDDLSQEESEISEIYNELLDYPVILNQIDITRHHRILSKTLEFNKSNFNYAKFIEFISESIKNERYEAQSLLIYFDETDFSSFSTQIDEMKQQGGFDDHFLSYRNDRYLNLFDQRFSEEQRNTEMKTQLDEILRIVHRNENEIHNFHNENCSLFEEIKNELQQQKQQNHELEERILNELKTENSTLKRQLERIESENEEMKNEMNKKIDEMIQQHQTTIEEMKKLNFKLFEEFGKHFDHLEQTIQIEHNKTKESLQNELKTSLSKLQELSKLNEVQQNQTKIFNQIQQINNYFPHKCSFVSESKFDGILNYLHHNSQVQLTSGHKEAGDSYKVTNIIDYSNTSDTYYAADADQGTNWIEFNFLTRKIDLSSYQIKSYPYNPGSWHPKKWEIRGSNDQNHWDTLDERENCSDLNGYNFIKHFICKTPTHKHYQYIRFYQFEHWDSSSCSPFHLRFSRFELYGDIYKT